MVAKRTTQSANAKHTPVAAPAASHATQSVERRLKTNPSHRHPIGGKSGIDPALVLMKAPTSAGCVPVER